MRQNPDSFSSRALPRTPLEELATLPQTPSLLGEGYPIWRLYLGVFGASSFAYAIAPLNYYSKVYNAASTT